MINLLGLLCMMVVFKCIGYLYVQPIVDNIYNTVGLSNRSTYKTFIYFQVYYPLESIWELLEYENFSSMIISKTFQVNLRIIWL